MGKRETTNNIEMKSACSPADFEEKWYRYWEERGFFHARTDSDKPTFSMVIPPPNVTGVLHMGHALNNTLQDVLARWKRMQGFEVLWIPGTDHAGIATQNVVERQLEKEGKSRKELGRERFIERVWEWKEEYGGTIIKQLKRLGCSCDWERERFTMDEGCSLAVRTVFKRLYDEGLIYKGEYIINWCPRCLTALSDIEVEYREKRGHLWYVAYPYEDGDGEIVVATTRPETMLGDTAVAVHPEDSRYKNAVGRAVIVPLVGRVIPVIADALVDPDFGTGAVKVTPAHDPADFEIGINHGLERVNIFNKDATVNENGLRYAGLDRYEAREAVLNDLMKEGALKKTVEHLHSVGHCYRCGTEVEPYLSEQWFVRMKGLAREGIAAVRDGRIRFVPSRWEKVYFDWMENIKDWCISRQLWWGHRIPVWYCEDCGETIVSVDEPDGCNCGSGRLRQDPDVLDTWFSSGLWPFSTMGWPRNTPELEVFYPTSVLTTGFDIIFFWVARMIMLGLHFMGDVPFREVFVTALVRDYEGKKMSKSSGNVIDPIDVIEVYGTDALRFTLASIAVPGRDINLAEERIVGMRNFVNKIWNAARLVISNLKDFNPSSYSVDTLRFELADRWIMSKLSKLISKVTQAMSAYNFSVAGKALHRFFWGEFCDWYLEIAKSRFYRGSGAENATAKWVSCTVLECALRLLHPYMPFVTEEIWQRLPHTGETIMYAKWPSPADFERDESSEKEMDYIKSIVTGIRSARSEHMIPPSDRLNATIVCGGDVKETISRWSAYIVDLCGIDSLKICDSPPADEFDIRVVTEIGEAYLKREKMVDVVAEIDRLSKKLSRIEVELERVKSKLLDEQFLTKAPPEIVRRERQKEEELSEQRRKLDEQLRILKSHREER